MAMAKKHTKAEKLQILKEAEKHGTKVILEKYGLYPATFYYWKKKFQAIVEAGRPTNAEWTMLTDQNSLFEIKSGVVRGSRKI